MVDLTVDSPLPSVNPSHLRSSPSYLRSSDHARRRESLEQGRAHKRESTEFSGGVGMEQGRRSSSSSSSSSSHSNESSPLMLGQVPHEAYVTPKGIRILFSKPRNECLHDCDIVVQLLALIPPGPPAFALLCLHLIQVAWVL